MAELLSKHEDQISSVSLVPSSGGCFEVTVNDQLVYSKLGTGRHAEQGEVARLLADLIQRTG